MTLFLRASNAGRAVLVSSGAAQGARAYWGAYAVSKAGLEAMARAWAAESEKTEINKIVSKLSSVIEEDGQLSRDLALAALYQLASKFNEDGDDDTKSNTA